MRDRGMGLAPPRVAPRARGDGAAPGSTSSRCHEWRPDDVLIRDNLCALHKATFDFDPNSRRHLPRVVLRGERLVLET